MKNKRYWKTEKAILVALLKFRHFPSMGVVARHARVAKSTAYRHHNTSYEILTDYEDFIVNRYRREMRRLLRIRHVRLMSLFRRLLIVLITCREELGVLLEGGWGRVIERSVVELKPRIRNELRLSDKQSDILVKEIAVVIELWGQKGFLEEEMVIVLCDIKYLIETARLRLGPLET